MSGSPGVRVWVTWCEWLAPGYSREGAAQRTALGSPSRHPVPGVHTPTFTSTRCRRCFPQANGVSLFFTSNLFLKGLPWCVFSPFP